MTPLPRTTLDMGDGVSLGITGPPVVNGHGVVVVDTVRVRRVIVTLYQIGQSQLVILKKKKTLRLRATYIGYQNTLVVRKFSQPLTAWTICEKLPSP